jgi:hypothetical protein
MVHQGISRRVLRGPTYASLVIEPSIFVEGDLAEWLALLFPLMLVVSPYA